MNKPFGRLNLLYLQTCLTALDSGMRESLNEVVAKVLRRVATQPDNTDDDIDDTVLV